MREIYREYYGNDSRAINRHSIRTFEDSGGNLYHIDRNTSLEGRPFTLYGPYSKNFRGILPKLCDLGERISWKTAILKMKEAVK